MEKFKYVVQLEVELEAFDKADADDAVQDVFSPGEEYGILITKAVVKEVK
jgi:hypothetical protein